MGRHNREGKGADQQGFEYQINYQPDWLRMIKVTRTLDSGRQSTKTLFRNPVKRREATPGERVRTRVVSSGQGVDMEVAVSDPYQRIRRVQVTCALPRPDGGTEEVTYTLEDAIPAAPGD